MREHNLRTPQKENHHQFLNRRVKWSSDQSKKISSKKCLNSVFTPGSEDVKFDSPKELINLSPIFEVSADNQLFESVENCVDPSSSVVSPAVSSVVSDLTQLSSVTVSDVSPVSCTINSEGCPLYSMVISEKAQVNDVLFDWRIAESSDAVKKGSIMAELVAKQLRQAGMQAPISTDMIVLSKDILNALLMIVIEDIHDLPEKRERFTEIVDRKVFVVLRKVFYAILTCLLLIVVFMGVLFVKSGGRGSYDGLYPT